MEKNTRFQASAGCAGISEQSMQGASIKEEAAAGPSDVGEGENLGMNPTIYPVVYGLQRTEGKFHISTSAAIDSFQAVSHSTLSELQLSQDG